MMAMDEGVKAALTYEDESIWGVNYRRLPGVASHSYQAVYSHELLDRNSFSHKMVSAQVYTLCLFNIDTGQLVPQT
jgi:hypothetical protein